MHNQLTNHKEHFHGSDLEKIEQIYHIKKESITSFSANVNPLGISFRLRETLTSHIDAIATYPDRKYTSLRNSISQYVNAPSEHIIVGNGSTELISILIQSRKPKQTLILGPTYSEYQREITLQNGICEYFPLQEDKEFQLDLNALLEHLTSDIDLFILCNPNNPTSSVLTTQQLYLILQTCREHGIFVMIDETYVEFAPDISAITAIPLTSQFQNLIVLRGVSKFFAAPGLRLGYGVCSCPELLTVINEKKNPWTINSLAAIAGEIMFQDQEYIDATRTLIHNERTRIVTRLRENPNLKVFEPYGNFVLVKLLNTSLTSQDVFDAAIRKGLMIRDCSGFSFLNDQFIRFCFMSPEKNDELTTLLLDLI
ncbi:threonine-phosphate decarboxylase [Anaeromicropila populeti]|uniref:Aminotransferase n=1 Tax=Anaeromicropila populeti TaxID=37658 RepID=A0A1I6KLV4_9FIRM|nr:histidinol-phosphate transaminase [Anaeromicropila populeti]SFR92018.1 threonine-phosphate decarboxylase [Anaeromicropila populeti]